MSDARGPYPTWKYRWFRIRFSEYDRSTIAVGFAWYPGDRELTLSVGHLNLTWVLLPVSRRRQTKQPKRVGS